MDLLLALLLRLLGGLVLGESAAQGTGVLGSEVEREELLVLVEQAELGALVEVDDGENAGDRLANVVAVKSIVSIYPSIVVCLKFAIEICGVVCRLFPFTISTPTGFVFGIKNWDKNSTRTFSGSSRRHRQRSSGHGAG